MQQSTRAFAVLAALVLVLAPVTNGVLQEAAETAERVFLEPADWDREPPEDPPNATPPEDLPEGNRSFNGSAGPRPSCEVTTEPATGWEHRDPSEDPIMGAQNRSRLDTTRSFEVNDTLIGLGVALRIENLTGPLSASVYPDGEADDAPFSYERAAEPSQQRNDVNETSTIPRGELVNRTWYAELDHTRANYDELQFVVVKASCAGAAG